MVVGAQVYRLITRQSYEQAMFQSANQKLGLDQAVLQSMSASTSERGASTTKPQLSSKEVESLLRNGAYALVDEDGDAKAEQFQADSLDKILGTLQGLCSRHSECDLFSLDRLMRLHDMWIQ